MIVTGVVVRRDLVTLLSFTLRGVESSSEHVLITKCYVMAETRDKPLSMLKPAYQYEDGHIYLLTVCLWRLVKYLKIVVTADRVCSKNKSQ